MLPQLFASSLGELLIKGSGENPRSKEKGQKGEHGKKTIILPLGIVISWVFGRICVLGRDGKLMEPAEIWKEIRMQRTVIKKMTTSYFVVYRFGKGIS